MECSADEPLSVPLKVSLAVGSGDRSSPGPYAFSFASSRMFLPLSS